MRRRSADRLASSERTALRYTKDMGLLAVPIQIPPNLPPVGASLATEEGTAIRADVHVPTYLMQSLMAASLQAKMQMQGGLPPGGGL